MQGNFRCNRLRCSGQVEPRKLANFCTRSEIRCGSSHGAAVSRAVAFVVEQQCHNGEVSAAQLACCTPHVCLVTHREMPAACCSTRLPCLQQLLIVTSLVWCTMEPASHLQQGSLLVTFGKGALLDYHGACLVLIDAALVDWQTWLHGAFVYVPLFAGHCLSKVNSLSCSQPRLQQACLQYGLVAAASQHGSLLQPSPSTARCALMLLHHSGHSVQ